MLHLAQCTTVHSPELQKAAKTRSYCLAYSREVLVAIKYKWTEILNHHISIGILTLQRYPFTRFFYLIFLGYFLLLIIGINNKSVKKKLEMLYPFEKKIGYCSKRGSFAVDILKFELGCFRYNNLPSPLRAHLTISSVEMRIHFMFFCLAHLLIRSNSYFFFFCIYLIFYFYFLTFLCHLCIALVDRRSWNHWRSPAQFTIIKCSVCLWSHISKLLSIFFFAFAFGWTSCNTQTE